MTLGGCLCGSVRYRITGALAAPIACHCSQCGRTSGNFAVMARCKAEDLEIASTQHLTWYQSSPTVQRGFCSKCGGNLFWKDAGPDIYVTAGTLDRPTGLKVCEHIFAASKSDFYDISDGLPQKPEW
ncbi:MAG: GFA family protein [Hyphomicrobium sp.]|nr:GFA family protein [Hyphomicrobium sp.]